MSVKLSPILNEQQLDNNGLLLAGGKIYWYLSGTTTPVTVYQDSAGLTPHTAPIVLNARGEPPAPIWITTGDAYTAVLTDALGNSIRTIDNISGINDAAVPVISEWVLFAGAGSYVAATQFSVTGDQTSTFTVNRRVKIVQAGSTNYGTISVSAFSTVTTITVVLDSGTLIAGSYTLYYGFQDPTHASVSIFPVGTAMPFYNLNPPVGWTTGTIQHDSMMRLVTHAGVGAAAPGTFAGTTSPISITTVAAHTHTFTTGSTSTAHTHTYTGVTGNVGSSVGSGALELGSMTSGAMSANATHTHTGTSDSTGATINFKYMNFCLGVKT